MRSVTKGGSLIAFSCVAALVLLVLAHSPALAASSFSDVPDTHPYAPAIIDLKGRSLGQRVRRWDLPAEQSDDSAAVRQGDREDPGADSHRA